MIARLRARRKALLRSGIARNAISLYTLQLGSVILPLATLFFLTRRLGPQQWGRLAFMQALAAYVVFLVTYGFHFSGTREVAQNRHDPDRLAELFVGVLGAKVFLAILSLLIVIPATMLVPPIQRVQSLLWPGMLWAFAVSLSLSWYYQGLERMGIVARWETAARVLSLCAVLVLVHSPADAWKVLVIQGSLLAGAVAVEMAVAYRGVRFRVPTRALVWQTLRMGWSTFLLQGALSLYTIGNGFILGLLTSSTAAVGYYVGAERISKGLATLLNPVTQAIYPRTSHLATHARPEAARLARLSLLLMGAVACLMGVSVFIAAPLLVRVVLGPGFESAVPVLRILALLPPLVVVNNVLAVQWMLALGLDRLVNRVVFAAGLLNVVLAIALVPHYVHVGMAVAVVASEALITAGLFAVLRAKHLDPLALGSMEKPTVPATLMEAEAG
jgi:PST family polysaccharide transporter